jgi:hypothetical protein
LREEIRGFTIEGRNGRQRALSTATRDDKQRELELSNWHSASLMPSISTFRTPKFNASKQVVTSS